MTGKAFEFLFAQDQDFRSDQLQQGDLLFKDDSLSKALGEAHSYYADAPDYTHLLVLTQSCDLVRRGKSGPKSRYITLAAVRPVGILTKRLKERYADKKLDFPVPIFRKNQERLVADVIEKLLHNTADGYFFIPKDSHPAVNENLCAFLSLSVALRASHYDVCLESKVAQLENVFQAKLGWLTGNQYSRVGTPDIEEQSPNADQIKEQFLEDLLYDKCAWLNSLQVQKLKSLISEWEVQNPGQVLHEPIAYELLGQVPDPADILAEKIADKLLKAGLIKEKGREATLNLLRNDVSLKQSVTARN